MIALPEFCVVDVNVGIAANGNSSAGLECQLSCVEVLEAIMTTGKLAIDNLERIWGEYTTHLQIAGEPGVGDAFLRWIHENQWSTPRCETVPITPTAADPKDFEEFPRDAALSTFDRSDRVYAAVAVVAQNCLGPAAVINATDSDWKHHDAAFAANGINVVHVCPVELKAAGS